MKKAKIFILFVIYINLCTSAFLQNIDSAHNELNIKELTEKFLWEYYFALSGDYDSLFGSIFVLEPILFCYPGMQNYFNYHQSKSKVFDLLPLDYNPSDYSDSFSIEIHEKLKPKIISADEIDNPYRMIIGSGVYFHLSPLIPTYIDDHFIFFSRRFFFGAYTIKAYLIGFIDGDFETVSKSILQRRYSYWYSTTTDPLHFGVWKSDCKTIIINEDSNSEKITPALLEKLIYSDPKNFLSTIIKPLLVFNDFCNDGDTFSNVFNFLNYGNNRLNYWMNLLHYHRDQKLKFKRFEWSIPVGKFPNDDRVIFLEKLPWIYDLNWLRYDCLYRAPWDESNVSISDIYLIEDGLINIIVEVNYPGSYCRMGPSQVYLLTIGYDSDIEEFFIIDEELISGTFKWFFIK